MSRYPGERHNKPFGVGDVVAIIILIVIPLVLLITGWTP